MSVFTPSASAQYDPDGMDRKRTIVTSLLTRRKRGTERWRQQHHTMMRWGCGGAGVHKARLFWKHAFLLEVQVKRVLFRVTFHVLGNSPEGKRKAAPRRDAGLRFDFRTMKNHKHATHSLYVRHAWLIVVQRWHQFQDSRTIVHFIHNCLPKSRKKNLFVDPYLSIRLFRTPASYIVRVHKTGLQE